METREGPHGDGNQEAGAPGPVQMLPASHHSLCGSQSLGHECKQRYLQRPHADARVGRWPPGPGAGDGPQASSLRGRP